MAEGVGEDDVAAFVNQVQSSLIAVVGLGDVALHDDLILGEAQGSNSFDYAVDEVQVIGGILVVQQDDAQLDIFHFRHGGESEGAQAQRQRKDQGKKLVHWCFLLNCRSV